MLVELWGGAVVIDRAQTVKVDEPNARIERVHSGWVGLSPIAHRLAETFSAASHWTVLHPAFEEIGEDKFGRLGYRVTETFVRTTLWVDAESKRAQECLIENNSYGGWQPSEDIEFGVNQRAARGKSMGYRMAADDTPPPPKPQPPKPKSEIIDMSSPETWSRLASSKYLTFTLGEKERVLRRVDANAEGSIFLLIDSLQPGAKVEIARDGRLQPYASSLEQWTPPKLAGIHGHALVLVATRVQPARVSFPLKLHFRFQEAASDSVGIGDLDLTIPAPTCQLLPFYKFSPVGDEFLYYGMMARDAERRALYYANPKTTSTFYRNTGNLGLVTVQDRERAISELEAKIFYTRLQTGDTRSDVTATDWINLYDLLRSLGRDDEAKKALELSALSLPTNSFRSDVAIRIRRAQSEVQLTQ